MAAASTISVFGDKRQYKDGEPGRPAFDLLRWMPDPFVDLFEKEAVVNIYFNTDTDAIIKNPKTGEKGLKNRGSGKNAAFIRGQGCTFPSVEGYYENHKYLALTTDEKKDPKHPRMSCFDIKNIATGTATGQNCIIFISFRNQSIDEKQRILFTNDRMTRAVQTKKSDTASELVIQCGIRSTSIHYNTKQWQQLKVQYTCNDDVTECNYTLYNHGSKDIIGSLTSPTDPEDTSINFFIAGYGPSKPQHVAGQYDLSQLQVYNFFNHELLPTQMTNLIIQKLYSRAQQHHTKNSSSIKTSSIK